MSVAQEKFSYGLPQESQQQNAAPQRLLSKRAIRKGKILLTGGILALFLTGVSIAYYYAQVAAVGYQISEMQKELANLKAEQEYLESQANQLMSLQRIEAIATTKLGMVKPDPKEVVVVAALPKSPQSGQNPTDQPPPGVTEYNAQEKDNHGQSESRKSPVIEAFMDMVNRWEKK
ncbi:MAG: cell division protein FtsL [Bacillota bacterium]